MGWIKLHKTRHCLQHHYNQLFVYWGPHTCVHVCVCEFPYTYSHLPHHIFKIRASMPVCLHNRCLRAAPVIRWRRDQWDRRALKNDSKDKKTSVARRCREEGDGWRDGRMKVAERQSGKVNIYSFICWKETMLPICATVCELRVLWNANVRHTGATVA